MPEFFLCMTPTNLAHSYAQIWKNSLFQKVNKTFPFRRRESKRDFLPTINVAELLVQLAISNAAGTFNIASGRPMTVADFAQTLTSENLNIISQGKSNDLYADTTKLVNYLSHH